MHDPESRPVGETPYFSAELRPHRSLGRTGFIVLMALVGSVSFIAGMVFLLHGAWPVFGFFGLDAALIYLAFKLNYRSGRLRETVDLARDRLLVRRIQPNGRTAEWSFQPYWVRVEIEEDDGIVGPLILRSHGRQMSIAGFLSGEERLDFAIALKAALARGQA